MSLLTSDLGVQTTNAILEALRDRARRQAIEGGEELRDLLKEELRAILEAPQGGGCAHRRCRHGSRFWWASMAPARRHRRASWRRGIAGWTARCCLCAADTFRAAAIEQLEVWAARSGVEMIKTRQGGDPAAVLYDAASAAKARKIEELIVDTAGRLHTKTGLMDELEKMRRTAAKLIPGAPHEVLLVMDATTGQNGLNQARQFTQAAGVTGIVLTKLDGTAKGGIAVAIAQELNLPVRFVASASR